MRYSKASRWLSRQATYCAARPVLEQLESRRLMTAGPQLSILNADPLPYNDRLIFNRIQNQNPTLGDRVHDTGTLRLINTGDQPLTIHSMSLSSAAWQILNAPAPETTLDIGAELDVQVQFVATTLPSVPYNETAGKYSTGGGVYNGSLTINTDDAAVPARLVALAGYWQKDSEHGEEPSLQTIVNLLGGYKTNIASGIHSTLGQSASLPSYYGEEITSPYWMAADPTTPVSIQQLDSWHVQGNLTFVSTFNKGDSADPTPLWATLNDAGQQLFPDAYGPDNTIVPAAASFSPAGAFGFKVDGEYSDDTLNTTVGGAGHHFRFYPMRDQSGVLVPNTFIMAQDYGGETANFDFQDGVFIVSNIRPDGRLAVPTNLLATPTPNLGVSLQWSANIESNVAGYNVYRGNASTGSFSKLNQGLLAAPGFIDSGAWAGKTYYYRVMAVNPAGEESYPAVTAAIAPVSKTVHPSSPTGITATAFSGKQINVSWNDVVGESGYKIERSSDGVNNWKQIGLTSANVTTFNDIPLAGATSYFYRVRAYNPAGSSWTIGAASAKTSPGLPAGWNYADVGPIGIAGSAVATGGVYTLTASGADISNTADEFHFATTSWSGNGQIIARIDGLSAADPDAKAGVMFRDFLDPASRSALMSLTVGGQAEFNSRTAFAGLTTAALQPGTVAAPIWIKIIRAGSLFTGFTSNDGVQWTLVGSAIIPMNNTVLVGLAACSHDDTAVATATFDQVNISKVTAPIAPTGLLAFSGAPSTINLSWLDNSADETSFKIERSTDGIHFSQIATADANVTAWQNTGLTKGKKYYYRVRATDAGIDSLYTNISSALA